MTTINSKSLPMPISELPASLMQLDDWVAVSVQGEQSRDYLQGQLTCDLNQLTETHYTLAAHCDAKGKVWSDLLLFPYKQGYIYILRRSVMAEQVAALKKYAIFAKVTIEPLQEYGLLGIAGVNSRTILADYYANLPDEQTPVTTQENTTLLHLTTPCERFLLMAPTHKLALLQQQISGTMLQHDNAQWLVLQMAAGYPVIDLPTSAQFLPQALNLQALNAISFTKGCYCGQEMVARAKYRGANKRALYLLTGHAKTIPAVGTALEVEYDGYWRQTGVILAAVLLSTGEIMIQAVLNNDLTEETPLRLPTDADSRLHRLPLPYSLTD